MLPRISGCCLRRHVPRNHPHLYKNCQNSASIVVLNQFLQICTQSSSGIHLIFPTRRFLRLSPFSFPAPIQIFNRYKSTKLLQKNRIEPEESPQKRTVKAESSLEKTQPKQKRNPHEIDLPPSLTKLSLKSTYDITPQKTPEEEEKSRRRYEKEDPPEEERHKYWKQKEDRAINKALMRTDFFDNMSSKNKETFAFALELFTTRDVHLRGHVEFIYSALKEMKKFGVHRDLESYKKLVDIFPKGKMIPTNMFQAEFMHFPKHQQCAIDLLEQMEGYGVIPDTELQDMLTNVFGRWSHPIRKAGRMLYWMPKFKNLCPWKLPDPLPDSSFELARLAVAQMTSPDLTTKIEVYNCEDLEDAQDMTWIVSGQSPEQQALIEKLPKDRPIYVEGAFRMWMKHTCMNYFILRADPKPPRSKTKSELDPDEVGNISSVFDDDFREKSLASVEPVHEQDDGIILALCCTGTSSRDSLVSWIRFLEDSNPRLGKDITVWFTLKSPIGPTDDIEILSYRDLEELKRLGKPRDPFLAESTLQAKNQENLLEFDPGMPDLRQTGIWTESETRLPNWPHHYHKPDSISVKNREENEKLLEELERKALQRKTGESHQQISVNDNDHEKIKQPDEDKKRIE